MSQWFRFYTSALHDPKVQRLPPDLFKAWVNLLCVAALNNGELPNVEDVAYHLGHIQTNKAAQIVAKLHLAGLLDEIEGGYFAPHNWGGRQYKSDTSTPRVKRFRDGKRNVSETVAETKTETHQNRAETDTETESTSLRDVLSEPSSDASKRKRISYSEDFEAFWKGYPTDPLMSKKQAFDAWKRLTPEDRAKAHSAVPAFDEHCRKNPDYRPLHAVRFLSQRRFDGFTTTVSSRPPPDLSPEERAKWVRDQMEADREKTNGGTTESSGAVLDRSDRFRAA